MGNGDYREMMNDARSTLEAGIQLERRSDVEALLKAHEAAEKALKAVLQQITGNYKYTHNLAELQHDIEEELGETPFITAKTETLLDNISDIYPDFKYSTDYSKEDVRSYPDPREVLNVIEGLINDIEEWDASRG